MSGQIGQGKRAEKGLLNEEFTGWYEISWAPKQTLHGVATLRQALLGNTSMDVWLPKGRVSAMAADMCLLILSDCTEAREKGEGKGGR